MLRSKAMIEMDIGIQLQTVDEAMKRLAAEAKNLNVNPTDMRLGDGSSPLTPLMVTRSSLVLAEVMLRGEK